MIAFEKIQAGMTLYDRQRYRLGSTTMSTLGEWHVFVARLEGDRGAYVRWNSNPEEFWPRHRLEKLYTWSMHDPDEAVLTKGMLSYQVISVKRLPARERAERAKQRAEKPVQE